MITDTTFFTNESGYTLLDRFKKTLKHVQYFDVLVGYFRTSAFHQLYESFESVDKIRSLVGLNVDRKAYEIIEEARVQTHLDFESHKRTKHFFIEKTIQRKNWLSIGGSFPFPLFSHLEPIG